MMTAREQAARRVVELLREEVLREVLEALPDWCHCPASEYEQGLRDAQNEARRVVEDLLKNREAHVLGTAKEQLRLAKGTVIPLVGWIGGQPTGTLTLAQDFYGPSTTGPWWEEPLPKGVSERQAIYSLRQAWKAINP